MSRWWLLALLVPTTYLRVGRRHRGFRDQPRIVFAKDPEVFTARVAEAGGAGAVRSGVRIDTGFVLLALTAQLWLLLAWKGPWWLAGVAAALDFSENTVLVRALDGSRPHAVRGALPVLGLLKTAAYAVTVVAVFVAAWQAG